MKKLLIVILLVFPILSFADWWIMKVDTNAYINGRSSIALDSLQYPHIMYDCEVKSGPLRYAVWNPDSTWTIEIVAPNTLGGLDLELDSKCRPHVAYKWRYAYKDSTDWHFHDIPNGLEIQSPPSLALDNNNYPHIANFFVSDLDTLILHYYLDSTSWHFDTLELCSVFDYGVSIAINDSDKVHVVYSAGKDFKLTYAKKTGEIWHKELIDTLSNGIEGWSSIALDVLALRCGYKLTCQSLLFFHKIIA